MLTYLVFVVLLEVRILKSSPNYPNVTGHKGTHVRGEVRVEGDSTLNKSQCNSLTFANSTPHHPFFNSVTTFQLTPQSLERASHKVPEF